MTGAVVFVGPTIETKTAQQYLTATYLPPVSQGDVYRAALRSPRMIGIIDGRFDQVPAVWHKEILWAMASGIHVFGAASMGALRAAELASFGMNGIGRIFEAYLSGALEDDDEVALVHGMADVGYTPFSEAMVNIRATLTAAAEKDVIASGTAQRLEMIARRTHYSQRSYPAITKIGCENGLSGSELAAFEAWLPAGRVDRKREDAAEMLCVMAEFMATDPEPKSVTYHFEYTGLWDRLRRSAGNIDIEAMDAEMPHDSLVDELRLDEETWGGLESVGLFRLLGCIEARRQGFRVDDDTLADTILTFRRHRELFEPDDLALWMRENNLTREQFLRLMVEEAELAWVRASLTDDITPLVVNHLRMTGRYPNFVSCVRKKTEYSHEAGESVADQ